MSNSLSKLANVVTIVSFPFTTWPVLVCLILAVVYLSLDWWKKFALDHSFKERIGRLDVGLDRLQWEVMAPKEHLLSSEQCKEAGGAINE
jgi:hypothetical protein